MIMGLLLHGALVLFHRGIEVVGWVLYVFVATVSNILAYLNLSKHFNEL
jgi:hypothetical protein